LTRRPRLRLARATTNPFENLCRIQGDHIDEDRVKLMTAFLTISALAVAPLAGQQTFDHAPFDRLLKAHVVDGMVDYDAFRTAPDFPAYLATLAAFDPGTLGRDEQLAFWINAYNAYTIQLILKHNETRSIRNINKTGGIIKGYGPWNEKLARVGGVDYGLDHIEQKIIRPTYAEPRIHFALVCAARGCPPLRSEAYTGARLDEQLQDQGRVFLLESPDKNRVDVKNSAIYVSQVFKFRDYEKDFGGSKEAVARFIAKWYPAGAERSLLEGGQWKKFEYTDYDWSLNRLTPAT
jgi:hypothetical protein